jgi:raw score 12.31
MGNAPDEIKQAANRVTTSHNDDGIALILNEIFPE